MRYICVIFVLIIALSVDMDKSGAEEKIASELTVEEMAKKIILDYRLKLMQEKLPLKNEYNEYEWELKAAKYSNHDTLLISINGNAIHGDIVTLRFIPLPLDETICDRPIMEVWFSSTKNISKDYFHEDKGIPVEINGTKLRVTVEHIIDHPYINYMRYAVLHFGQPSREILENLRSSTHTNLYIRIMDGQTYDFKTEERSDFLATKWFDVDYNIWSLNGFFEKFDDAQSLCKSMATALAK
jgi:hypothetical protein